MVRLGENLIIERERDVPLHAYAYAVISHDREGNEVEGFTFYVSDTGRIFQLGPLKDLIE